MTQIHPFISERIADAMQSLGGLDPALTNKLIQAGAFMADQLVNDQKILALGLDSCAPLAQLFCQRLMYSSADQRPSLPALMLNDATGLAISNGDSGSANALGAEQLLLRKLKSFGQPGDVVLILSESLNASTLNACIECASAQQLHSVIIAAAPLAEPLNTSNQILYLPVEVTNLTRLHEVALFILNCLGDIIDEQLFGNH